MKNLIDLSLFTMRKADGIREGARMEMNRYYKTEQDVSLKTKRIISLLYDDICYWLCNSRGEYHYEFLFRAIVDTFTRFVDGDKLERAFNKQINRYK